MNTTRRHWIKSLVSGVLAMCALTASAQTATKSRANWEQAQRYSADNIRLWTGSSSLNPTFIGKTDRFWYAWRDRAGLRFMRVDPETRRKAPLFDHVVLAARLSELSRRPYESNNLPFSTVSVTEDGKLMRFAVENQRYESDFATQQLKKIAPERTEAQTRQERDEYRDWAPDKKAFVYAENHNLYFVEVGEDKKEGDPVQLTTDGVEFYSFGRQRSTLGNDQGSEQTNRKVRPGVTWSPDSKRFYVSRFDSRKVKDLWLVNVLAEPRPTLTTYKYAMPGEVDVSIQELHVFDRAAKKLNRANVEKYKDQRLFNLHWPNTSDRLRLVRRDRLQRNLELIDLDTAKNEVKVLLTESVENAFLETQPVRYVKEGGDFLWWSERTGWGHLYRYSYDGSYLGPVTTGAWRVNRIDDVDAEKGHVFFVGVGKESGENPYYDHLYRAKLDGSEIKLLDAGDANHTSTLSPSKKFVVSVSSRVDQAPKAVVRNDRGEIMLDLESMDLSRLTEAGWKMPETFVVKAADGTTDIYGNLWKPFDFDPKKSYPIILNVYPGPQTESVNATFSASPGTQQLAQLGFIVIQVGNRGGNPERSNAYHSFGYFNLRDYGLADKKAAVEQLAAKHRFIDVNRVGIYGHSGGGFMTAAAMMLPPYHLFFKVGVSSAGNHDNNIYNQNWSEQHHGLRIATQQQQQGQQRQSGSRQRPDWEVVVDAPADEKFEIKVPTTSELAPNLRGKLLIVHGDMDGNVHPGNSIRLANALILANKRFDFMLMPGQAHGFGRMQPYFNQMLWEYFAEHLLGDSQRHRTDMNDVGN